jgi:hypothetical protein
MDAVALDSSTEMRSGNGPTSRSDTRVAQAKGDEGRQILNNLDRADRPFVPESFRVAGLQKWTGRVLEVDTEVFSAELVPSGDGPTVVADFNRSQIAAGDDLAPGDVVYVTVRTVNGRSGQPSTTSAVRLRRLGNWSADDVSRHQSLAREFMESLEGLIG